MITQRPTPRRARITMERDEGLALLKLEHEITLKLRDMNVAEDMCELSRYLDACSNERVAMGVYASYEL